MANTYSSTPVLSKVKIGSQIYYVKDADVRALLDTYGDIVTYNVEATLSDGNKIPTGAAVTAAINTAVADLAGAMHFEGVKDALPETVEGYAEEKNPKFEMYVDKKGEYRFRLKARNGEPIAASEGYTAKAGCKNGIESVIRNAADSDVVLPEE